jgi:hypothetical protein
MKDDRGRFILKHFDSIEISAAPTYLVKDILPDIGLAVIYGLEKCGKSFWLFDLLMHVALGWEYRGHDVRQGPVVYLALEGGRGFAKRIVAWRQEHLTEDRDPVPFWLLDVRLDVARDHRELIATIKRHLGEHKPVAIAVDTLNRGLVGSENDPKDMSTFIQAADAIRETFDCLVPIVHHCPLVGGRPRGHSSLSGADDVLISVEKNTDSGIITTKVVHMKDDEAGLVLASKLRRVELARDNKNNPITSCIIEPVEADAGPASKPKRKLSDTSQFGLDLLVNLISDKDSSDAAPDHLGLPAGTRVTRAGTWRTRFIDDYQAIEDRENRGRVYRRAYGDLVTKQKLVGVQGEFVWLTTDLLTKPDNPDKKAA